MMLRVDSWLKRALPLLLGVAVSAVQPASGQTYPSKPVKIILQAGAGSGPDVIGRIVAEHLGQIWGQQVLIINRAGAGGLLAAKEAVGAEPDGYTLYQATTGGLLVLPVTQTLAFDFERDLTPIGFVGEQPYLISASPSLGAKTLQELITLARERPGGIAYVAGSRGGMPHLTAELFRSKAGIDLLFVPYPNVAQSLQDVMGGRIPVIVESMPGVSAAIEAGSVKPLAVTSIARLTNAPDLPTVAELIPGFAVTGWFALMAPAKTPSDIVQKVSVDLRSVLEMPTLQKQYEKIGTYVRTMTPAETAAFIRKQQSEWWPIVRQTLNPR